MRSGSSIACNEWHIVLFFRFELVEKQEIQ